MNWPKSPLPSLKACCQQGMFICLHCNKVAAIGMQENVTCKHGCKVYKIRWCPPAL